MREFETNRKQFMFDVGNLKNTFSEYVHAKQLEKTVEDINNKLEAFAPWDSVRGVYKEFFGYLKIGEFEKYQHDMEEKLEKMEKEIAFRMTLDREDSIRDWAESIMEDKLKGYSQISDCALDKKELQYNMDKFIKDFSEAKKFFDKTESEFNALRHLLTTKATVKQVAEIRGEMDVLATKENYKDMRATMQEFEECINKFRDESIIHAQIIRRYDEVISEKASKFNLLELEAGIRK